MMLSDGLKGAIRSVPVSYKAATEVATYQARLANVETRLSVLTWMAGANIAMTTAILFRVFH
jgi:hypothetical protein